MLKKLIAKWLLNENGGISYTKAGSIAAVVTNLFWPWLAIHFPDYATPDNHLKLNEALAGIIAVGLADMLHRIAGK